MKITSQLRGVALVMAGVLGAGRELAVVAQKQDSADEDRMAIEQLHQLDVKATLTDKADDLAKLWDKNAIRIQPGEPAEIGKATIYADDKRWEATNSSGKTLCYRPEIWDLWVSRDWASEWGYFSYKSSADGKVETGGGKFLRALHRQPDGSWKFALVMVIPEKLRSAAPSSHPCE